MKKITLILAVLCLTLSAIAQQNEQVSIVPETFTEDQEITITLSGFDPAVAMWSTSDIYIWGWSNNGDAPNNGMWQDSNETNKLTNNGDGTYTYVMTPSNFYGTGLTNIGFLFKADDGSDIGNGDQKTKDFNFEVQNTLSVSDFEKEDAGFSLYPTLATNVINFTADVQEVIVFNTAGVIVKSFTGDYRAGAGFDINELTSGLYIVQATNKKGIFGSFKMIK